MSVLEELRSTLEKQRRVLDELEPGCYSGSDALALLRVFSAIERLGAAGRTLVAKRVEESNIWRDSGTRSASEFIAGETGTTVGRAQANLETAEQLRRLPATAAAFRTGALSETQAEAVAGAAAANPNEEARLLRRAEDDSVKQLRAECRRVQAAVGDQEARYQAIKRDRHVHTWTDSEGALCGRFRTTSDAGARLVAVLEAETDRIFKAARKEGRREPRAAHAMDALEALVCAGGSGKRAEFRYEICVLADYRAMVNGFVSEGEAVEIAGLGPVPVSVVESWLPDAYLRLIVTDGLDIKAMSRTSRYIDPHTDAALLARDRKCVIAGCDVDWRLQRDHRVPFAQGGPTCLDNLQWLCWWHHLLKTKGWVLVGGLGCYRLAPPGRDSERAPP